MKIVLSERMSAIAKLIKPKAIVADIGTDHGWIPAYLLKQNLANYVYLTDVRAKPLLMAKKNLTNYQIDSKLYQLLLGDGLLALPANQPIDVCIIAGMGNTTILQILKDDHSLIASYLFCTTSQTAFALRNWVQKKGYFIENEELIIDNNRYYEIILVNKVFGTLVCDQIDLWFGPLLKYKKTVNFELKWENYKKYLESLLIRIPFDCNTKRHELTEKINLISLILIERRRLWNEAPY